MYIPLLPGPSPCRPLPVCPRYRGEGVGCTRYKERCGDAKQDDTDDGGGMEMVEVADNVARGERCALCRVRIWQKIPLKTTATNPREPKGTQGTQREPTGGERETTRPPTKNCGDQIGPEGNQRENRKAPEVTRKGPEGMLEAEVGSKG